MKVFKLLAHYLYLGKRPVSENENSMLRAMHRINRISLLMFILCLMIIVSILITGMVLS